MKTTTDVLVIGGGLAGLTAAATASAQGARALVLEAHRPGGRSRVSERDGFTFNHGGHALYVAGEGMAVLRRLGVRPKGSPPPLGAYQLLAGGSLHRMPVGPGSLLRTTALSVRSKAAVGKLLVRVPKLDAADFAGISVDGWIADQDLRDDAVAVLRALVRIGTYSSALDELSAGAALQQLQRSIEGGVLYLDGGWAQLVDGLRSQVELRPNVAVESITDAGNDGVQVRTTGDDLVTARSVVLAAGSPEACASLLGADPDSLWPGLGAPVTASCLDVGVRGVPSPGYVLGVDEPVYGTVQSPPAKQAPEGDSVVAVIRYGARSAAEDRPQLEGWLDHVGVHRETIVCERFLARMIVVGAAPRAITGGLTGRPSITSTGMPNVLLAGDWVGREGMLADASFASGQAAGRAAAADAAAPTSAASATMGS
ncbi:MAG TPA: FAD-dependent oxidoreductase [Acidimicrobiales bacterium]|nr:FAD-dependent oxidoreductase [Acidimicrobiales bacterium]